MTSSCLGRRKGKKKGGHSNKKERVKIGYNVFFFLKHQEHDRNSNSNQQDGDCAEHGATVKFE